MWLCGVVNVQLCVYGCLGKCTAISLPWVLVGGSAGLELRLLRVCSYGSSCQGDRTTLPVLQNKNNTYHYIHYHDSGKHEVDFQDRYIC